MKRWFRRIAEGAILVGAVRLFRTNRRRTRAAALADGESPPLDGDATPGTGGPAHPAAPLTGAAGHTDAAADAPPAGARHESIRTRTNDAVQIVKSAWKTSQERQVSLMAAGVTYYAFVSLFPMIIATIMVYGLVADTSTIERHAARLAEAVPESARELVLEQVKSLASVSQSSLSLGLVVALGVALWGASGALSNLMSALNVAYGVRDTRPFAAKRAIALGLTIATVIGGVCLLGLVAVFPAVRQAIELDGKTWAVIGYLRWAVLVVGLLIALAVVYRVGPDTHVRTPWHSVGALTAAGIWLVASFGFSYYVSNFSSYGATYGSLAGVVVLLIWMWISFYIVLLGASINAETIRRASPPPPSDADASI